MDKKREDATHMEVMERVERSIKQVKQEGKLDLSRDGFVLAITLALTTGHGLREVREV